MANVNRRRARRRQKDMLHWILEFSKKVVTMCAVMYAVVFITAIVIIWRFVDTSALPTLIAEASDVMKVCVFGYMVKAGIENWQKIRNARDKNNEAEAEQWEGDEGQ